MTAMGCHMQVTDLTGRVIARTWNTSERACWFTVEPVIAEWFGVLPEEIHIDSDPETGDFVTVSGQRVAEMHTRWDRPERDSARAAA